MPRRFLLLSALLPALLLPSVPVSAAQIGLPSDPPPVIEQEDYVTPSPEESEEEEETAPLTEEEEKTPDPEPAPPEEHRLSGQVWVDVNDNGKHDRDEHVLTSSMKVVLNDGTELSTPTDVSTGRYAPVTVTEGSVDYVETSIPRGFTPSEKRIDAADLDRRGGQLFATVPVRPDASFSVEQSHTADGEKYHLTYVVKNTGTAPLTISGGETCGEFTLQEGEEETCERERAYRLTGESHKVHTTFTAVFSHEGEVITELTENVETSITEKSPEEEPATPPATPETVSPDPMEETEEPAPVVEDESSKPWWLFSIPLALLLAALGIHLYVRRKRKNEAEERKRKREAKETEEKARRLAAGEESGTGPLSGKNPYSAPVEGYSTEGLTVRKQHPNL